MKKNVFYLTLYFTFTIFFSCSKSIKIQQSVKTQFLYKSRFLTSEINNINNGDVGILLKYKEDTLNKEMLHKSAITISSIIVLGHHNDSLTSNYTSIFPNASPNEKNPLLALLFCNASKVNDTLILDFSLPINQLIQYKVMKKNVSGSYKEIYKEEKKILKYTISSSLLNHIDLPMKEQLLVLNDNNFLVNKIIYGKASFKSDPYFIQDDNFNGGYLQRQISMEYLFRVKIME